MFAKTGKAIVNLAATERIRLLKDTLEFYGLDGSVHTRVNFPPRRRRKGLSSSWPWSSRRRGSC